MIEIPLTNDPEQLFSIVINETTYDARVAYNSRAKVWSVSISTGGVDLVTGVPLVAGVDILKQYNFNLGSGFVVNVSDPTKDATIDDLGTGTRVFVLSDEEVSSVTPV